MGRSEIRPHFARHLAGGHEHVGAPLDERTQGLLVAVEGLLLVLGERDVLPHAPDALLGPNKHRLVALDAVITLDARHAELALPPIRVRAQPPSEVVVYDLLFPNSQCLQVEQDLHRCQVGHITHAHSTAPRVPPAPATVSTASGSAVSKWVGDTGRGWCVAAAWETLRATSLRKVV